MDDSGEALPQPSGKLRFQVCQIRGTLRRRPPEQYRPPYRDKSRPADSPGNGPTVRAKRVTAVSPISGGSRDTPPKPRRWQSGHQQAALMTGCPPRPTGGIQQARAPFRSGPAHSNQERSRRDARSRHQPPRQGRLPDRNHSVRPRHSRSRPSVKLRRRARRTSVPVRHAGGDVKTMLWAATFKHPGPGPPGPGAG